MGLKPGMNSNIFEQGVYVNDASNALLEYKIFHGFDDEPTHIIITNLRNGKSYGPYILSNNGEISEVAKKKLDEFANEHYPNK